jgi:hypothetical protein
MTADYLQKQSRPGWPPLSDDLQEGLSMWCPLPDSNRHGRCRPRDFKAPPMPYPISIRQCDFLR